MNSFALNWHQVLTLTRANMKARYRKTFVGFLWVILNPILMYTVQALVFKKFLRIDHPDYYIFLLGGLLPWIFINTSWDTCTGAIVNAGPILKSFQISPLVILAASLLDSFINFFAAFLIIIIPTLVFSQSYSINLLLLPGSLLLLVFFTTISTFLFATLHVMYRDIKYVIHFSMSLLFFLTPIFYPPDFIPANYQWLVKLNPIYIIIAPFRGSLYSGNTSELLILQVKGLVICGLLLWTFATYWKKRNNELFLKL